MLFIHQKFTKLMTQKTLFQTAKNKTKFHILTRLIFHWKKMLNCCKISLKKPKQILLPTTIMLLLSKHKLWLVGDSMFSTIFQQMFWVFQQSVLNVRFFQKCKRHSWLCAIVQWSRTWVQIVQIVHITRDFPIKWRMEKKCS